MTTRGRENYGLLLHFYFNDLHWKLNYRGDAPLLVYHINGIKDILQIDGDLFYPISTDLCDPKNTDDYAFDSYLFSMDEALKFINILFYEDMELEYDEEEDEDKWGDDYELSYEGNNEAAFLSLTDKVNNGEEILSNDIEKLTA